jgi:hypothetical protein
MSAASDTERKPWRSRTVEREPIMNLSPKMC